MGALGRPLGLIHFFMCATRVLRWGPKKLQKHLKTHGFQLFLGTHLGRPIWTMWKKNVFSCSVALILHVCRAFSCSVALVLHFWKALPCSVALVLRFVGVLSCSAALVLFDEIAFPCSAALVFSVRSWRSPLLDAGKVRQSDHLIIDSECEYFSN